MESVNGRVKEKASDNLEAEVILATSLNDLEVDDLGPSLSGSFMNLTYKKGAKKYYSQFGTDVQERFLIGSDGKVKASFTAFTRDLYQKDKGKMKVLFVSNVRTANTREALIGWSEKLLPEILKLKKEFSCDHALFFLSRRERGLFNFFIRPRKKREDQIKFSHLRGVRVQIVQGQKFFAEEPLKHITIRRGEVADLEKLSGYIKQASKYAPLARGLDDNCLMKEFDRIDEFSPKDLALAFNSEGEIVGALGALNMQSHVDVKFKFSDVIEPTFNALQSYLKIATWLTDLRPVSGEQGQPVKFFTHMYFNNHDIFYSLICWWIRQTSSLPKKERPIFMYPFYKGDLKAAAPESLFVSGFKGDIYLMQDPTEPPSELLKPVLFSESLDIDLPFLI